MRIGLVLPAVPTYSETFFRNKIRFLKETQGFDMVIFADGFSKEVKFDLCKVIYKFQFSTNNFIAQLQGICLLCFVLLRHPVKSIMLLRANRLSGFGFKKNITSLLNSFHIFKEKVDWLHFGFGTMAIDREQVANVIGAKMAVSFRGFDIAIYPLKNINCYALLWQQVNCVHVISDDLAKLVKFNGYPSDKPLVKILPAIDTTKFIGTEFKKELGLSVSIISIARLHWKKGLEYTLEALASLKDKGVDFHYTIIGEGGEYERLVFAVHQLDLNKAVTFTGKLSQDQIIQLLGQADIYLQYSIQEGFCNAVLEAQAMGLLCIVSDAEGLSENVIHEETGWVVPKRKPELLASKIREVITLENSRKNEIRQMAHKRVVKDFNLDLQKELFLKFYE